MRGLPLVALTDVFAYLARRSDFVLRMSQNHLLLAVLSVAYGFAVAFPLALLTRRVRWLYAPLLRVTTLLYTVPSLAFFVLLLPFLGLSRANALTALTAYSLLVLLRNTVAGLDGVPPEVVDAAKAMGYGPTRLLLRVELPLALPVIFAGLRIAMVTAIGLTVIAAAIGQPTLGRLLINDGFLRSDVTPIFAGMLVATAMSVTLDLALLGTQRLLTPWSRIGA